MEFQQRKYRQLIQKPDKSNIGGRDARIIDLCEKINKNKRYYTTSSCAGRIVLVKESLDKKPDKFLFRTHDKINFKGLKKVLLDIEKSKELKIIDFQQEPCILHVACFDIVCAQELIDKAKQVGWKKSGIMASRKRFVVELNSTEEMSFPIMHRGKILVNDDFLRLVVKEANKRLEQTWKKIENLRKLV